METTTGTWEQRVPPPEGPPHVLHTPDGRPIPEGAHKRIQVVELHMMDPVKYYPLTMLSGCVIRATLYPFTVIKTRMQLQVGRETYSGTFNALKTIFKNEGIPGFYRGFLVSNLMILSQVTYITVYENMRNLTEEYGGIKNTKVKSMLGGLSASVASQTLIVPIDIISQHLMVVSNKKKGFHTHTTLDELHLEQKKSRLGSTTAVIRGVYRKYGVRGFYKGYFASLAVYGPNSAMWWTFYDTYCGLVSEVAPSWVPHLTLQCLSAVLGGLTTSFIMNPMDVIRTRIQVKGERFAPTVRCLWAEERHRMFFKGLSARLIQSCTFSFAIILGYETIKRFSLLDEYKGSVRW